jgi:hypothetical protein
MIPKNAAMPRGTSNDKRIVVSFVGLVGFRDPPPPKNQFGSTGRRLGPGTLAATIVAFF